MGDDDLSPRSSPHEGGRWHEEPTRVRDPRRAQAAPVDEHRELPHILETQRIRPEQVNRRALPFKRLGGDRRGPEPVAVSEQVEAAPPEAAAPFASQPPGPPSASVWSREQPLDRAELPSALVPLTRPPPPQPRRDYAVFTFVALVVVLLALGGTMLVALR
jgi:hypothetical protein